MTKICLTLRKNIDIGLQWSSFIVKYRRRRPKADPEKKHNIGLLIKYEKLMNVIE